MIDPQLLLRAASRAHGAIGRRADLVWAREAARMGRRGWLSACALPNNIYN
jgi:hypothetical protein